MRFFLGVDVGGTKSHALIANELGEAIGMGTAGCGSWEGVGYAGLTAVLTDITNQALSMAGLHVEQLAGAGMGLAGYDWPSQRQPHLDAVQPLGLCCPYQIVNDAVLGILAGSAEGWGISVVSGTGCNCRGWSKDRQREGRVVGGHGYWSDEAGGAYDIIARAMRAVAFEWTHRGPATALSQAFIQRAGAKDLDDLIEGMYVGRYSLQHEDIMLVFKIASQGDPQALDVIRWAGGKLGQMACAVINQLDLQNEIFDIVLIGSLYNGHPLLTQSLSETVHEAAPGARLVRLSVPPVIGGVVLGMEMAGLNPLPVRGHLIETLQSKNYFKK